MLLWRIHLVWTSHANVRARSLFQTPVRSGGPTLIAPHARTVRSSSRQGKAASRTKTPPVGNSSVSEYKEEFKGDGKANGNNWQRRFRYLAELAWGLCVVHCVRRYVMETCYVSGPSMQPTIQENSVLLIDKVGFPAYGNKRLRRGDVVVVKSPDHPERSVVKRVTGLPGDWIQVRPPSSDPHNSQLIDKRSELVPEVASTYLPHLLLLAIGVLVAQVLGEAWNNRDSLREAVETTLETTSRELVIDLGWKSTALFVVFIWWMSRSRSPVYLIDFSTFEAPEEWKVNHAELTEIMRRQGCFTPESVAFMEKILSKSGTGQATAWPPGIIRCLKDSNMPADRSVEAARLEAEIVIFDVVASALKKAGVTGEEIDFLIINCSLFSPTPSLCSMVSHKFGMRSDARTYNLSGMGCSAGIISLDLAKDLLKARPNSVALVVSTENLTQNLYHGNERSMLLQNTLFRVGGAAIVLSNKWQDASRSKFKLFYTVRTQGAGRDAFEAVYETEDDLGHHGVRLSKEIVKVAGRAMEKNFTSLGPYVLPISEQYKVVRALALRKVTKMVREMLESRKSPWAKRVPVIPYYQPDFKRAIDHFCIHAGGRGVIDGIEKNLALQEHHTEPSRATLRDYGNTSSSSIWYEMKYIEDHSDLRRGQRVLQVAFGSGFKCNSAVWICLNPTERI